MGISGILRPNGIFIPCSYKNHGEAASQIPEKESEYCIYLSSGMETLNKHEASINYFKEKIYKPQLYWLIKNFFKLDKVQRKLFINYLLESK